MSGKHKLATGFSRTEIWLAAVLFFAFAGLRPAIGQIPGLPKTSQPAAPKPEPDRLGRDTPYGSVIGFLRAAEASDYDRAVRYLDIQPSAEANDRASQLLTILNIGLSSNLETLSKAPEGDLQDALPTTRELVGTIDTDGAKLDVLLDRVERDGRPVWLFSSRTLRHVPEVFQHLNAYTVDSVVPQWLRDLRVFSIPIYRWLGILVGVVLALVLAGLATRLLIPVLRPMIRRLTHQEDDERLATLRGPLRLIFVAIGFRAMAMISATVLGRQFWSTLGMILAVIGVAWLIIRFSDVVSELAARRLTQRRRASKLAVLGLFHRLFKIVVALLGGVVIVYASGKDVTALLAGLGLGGIAIAFAAQKTLENLFGGVSLISDEQVRVGDFCRFGDKLGTVHDVGLRSTRVRTLDRTILSIPNGQLSQMSLENFTLRDKFLFNHQIGLRYETTPGQLRQVLSETRELLRAHTRIEQESARIRLIGFGASAFTLEVFAYVSASDAPDFLQTQEALLLDILDIIVACGSGLAFPSQTMYVTRDKASDPTLVEEAAARMEQRREQSSKAAPQA